MKKMSDSKTKNVKGGAAINSKAPSATGAKGQKAVKQGILNAIGGAKDIKTSLKKK